MSTPLSLTAALSDDPSRLDCLTALALSRAVNKKNDDLAREGVVAGTYDIDMTVRLVGTIEVLEDTDKKPTVSIPMKEVHDLFAGRGTAEAVLVAAKEDNDGVLTERERNHLCYAHLYLGLYYEAIGETAKSAEHIRLAAFDYAMDHYMGKTAQVHAKLRGVKAVQ